MSLLPRLLCHPPMPPPMHHDHTPWPKLALSTHFPPSLPTPHTPSSPKLPVASTTSSPRLPALGILFSPGPLAPAAASSPPPGSLSLREIGCLTSGERHSEETLPQTVFFNTTCRNPRTNVLHVVPRLPAFPENVCFPSSSPGGQHNGSRPNRMDRGSFSQKKTSKNRAKMSL